MQDVFEEGPQANQPGETQPTEQQPQEGQQQPAQQLQEGEGAASPAASEQGKHVPLEALEAERKGRQDWKEKAIRAEEEARLLRERYERPQQQPGQQQDPVQTLQTLIVNERFNISEDLVRQTHTDVDETVGLFMEAAKQNPALIAQMHAHRSPWKFAYDEGKRLKFASEIGNDPEAYRKKVRAEVEAELRGQTPASSQSQQPAAQPLPQSLAGARSAGARGTTFTGPTPMENIFDR